MDIKPADRQQKQSQKTDKAVGTRSANSVQSPAIQPDDSKINRRRALFVAGIIVSLAVVAAAAYWFIAKNTEVFIKDPRPHAVSLVLGETIQAKTITRSGGDISVADEFVSASLSVAPDSVAGSTEFRMTSISRIEDLPEGMEFLGGVQVEPDGQTLAKAGWLSIELPDGADTSRLAAFRYHGQGQEFHLYPLVVKGNAAQLPVAGFSGYGLVHLNAEIEKAPVPTSVGDQAMAAIAEATHKNITDGSIAETAMTSIKDILRDWHAREVLPNLKGAVEDSSKAHAATSEWIRWLIVVQLYGFEEDFANEIASGERLLQDSLVNAFNNSSRACSSNKDATQIAAMYHWLGVAQLFGLDEALGSSESINDKIESCGKFKLVMRSTLADLSFDSQASATGEGTLGLDLGNFYFSGGGNIKEDDNVRLVGKSCSVSPAAEYSFSIQPAAMSISTGAGGGNLALVVEFGDTPYFDYRCDYMTLGQPFPEWMSLFMEAHEQDEIRGSGYTGFRLADWEIVNQDGVYARKVYQGTFNGVQEDTVFELLHLQQ